MGLGVQINSFLKIGAVKHLLRVRGRFRIYAKNTWGVPPVSVFENRKNLKSFV